MRQQTSKVKTMTQHGKGSILVCCAIAVVLLLGAYFGLCYEAPYVPPAFETEVGYGVPTPINDMTLSTVPAAYDFSVALCATMYQQEDGSLLLYFTNPASNAVNLSCEITDTEGNLLYKTGVIQPGEYVERVTPQTEFANEAMDIVINIYAFEPETWYSAGSITLDHILQAY